MISLYQTAIVYGAPLQKEYSAAFKELGDLSVKMALKQMQPETEKLKNEQNEGLKRQAELNKSQSQQYMTQVRADMLKQQENQQAEIEQEVKRLKGRLEEAVSQKGKLSNEYIDALSGLSNYYQSIVGSAQKDKQATYLKEIETLQIEYNRVYPEFYKAASNNPSKSQLSDRLKLKKQYELTNNKGKEYTLLLIEISSLYRLSGLDKEADTVLQEYYESMKANADSFIEKESKWKPVQKEINDLAISKQYQKIILRYKESATSLGVPDSWDENYERVLAFVAGSYHEIGEITKYQEFLYRQSAYSAKYNPDKQAKESSEQLRKIYLSAYKVDELKLREEDAQFQKSSQKESTTWGDVASINLFLIAESDPKIIGIYDETLTKLGKPNDWNEGYRIMLASVIKAYSNSGDTKKNQQLTLDLYEYDIQYHPDSYARVLSDQAKRNYQNALAIQTKETAISENAEVVSSTTIHSVQNIYGVQDAAQTQLSSADWVQYYDNITTGTVIQLPKEYLEKNKQLLKDIATVSQNEVQQFEENLKSLPTYKQSLEKLINTGKPHTWLTQEFLDFLSPLSKAGLTAELDPLQSTRLILNELKAKSKISIESDSLQRLEQALNNSYNSIEKEYRAQMGNSLSQYKKTVSDIGAKEQELTSDKFFKENVNLSEALADKWTLIDPTKGNPLKLYQILLNEFNKAGHILGYDEIRQASSEVELLRHLAQQRTIFLNAAVQAHEQKLVNLFQDKGEYGAYYDFNDILASKNASYKAKAFERRAVLNSNDNTLKSLYDSARLLQKELAEKLMIPKNEWPARGWSETEHEDKIKENKEQHKRIYRSIASKSNFADYAREWIIPWQHIQKMLKPDEAFVDIERIVPTGSTQAELAKTRGVKYAIFIITAKGQNIEVLDDHREILGGLAFERHALSLMEDVKKNNLNLNEAAFDIFWSPVAKNLKDIKRVYLLADGIYHTIPLDAMKNYRENKLLIEQYELIRLSEVTDIKSYAVGRRPFKLDNGAELFGFPDYNHVEVENINNQNNQALNTTKQRRSVYENTFSDLVPLPASKTEIDSIGKIINILKLKYNVYFGKTSSELNLKKINSPVILHLATHGEFKNSFYKGDSISYEADSILFLKNPLLNSKLFLAGANLTGKGEAPMGEDGVVTAEEIMHLNLSKTEVVVLSACETGLGDAITGESVFGMQRGFRMAGAKTLIMSLWKVADNQTQLLMTSFYRNLAKGNLSKQEAFRKAQLELKQKYPEPYYWAAFVMVGEQ